VPEDAGFPDASIPSNIDVSAFLKAFSQLVNVFLLAQAYTEDLSLYVLKCLRVSLHRHERKAAPKLRLELVPRSFSAASCDFD